jgi:ankyrin repeat protein
MMTKKMWLICLSSLAFFGVLVFGLTGLVLGESEPRVDMPLELAVQEGNAPKVRQLLATGADTLQKSSEDGKTPLHFGTDANLEACRVLIAQGAEVNAVDASGQTPLHDAAYEGSYAFIKLLLQHGAKTNIADEEGNTPLHEAVYGEEKRFPLKAKIAALLLDHRANIDATNQRKETPIFSAARIGNIVMFKLLLARGANTSRRFWEGGTLLHAAADSDEPQLVELLLKRGANINARDDNGMTPLHWAVFWGMDAISDNPRLVKLLVARGADLNARDSNDQTPRMIATDLSRSKVAAAVSPKPKTATP